MGGKDRDYMQQVSAEAASADAGEECGALWEVLD